MTDLSPPTPRSLDELSRALAEQVHTASPAISRLAQWVLDHPEEVAFHSVRALAQRAQVNANTVFRLSVALGFSGHDPCRAAFQAALRQAGSLYGSRADRIRSQSGDALALQINVAAQKNLSDLFTPTVLPRITEAVELLIPARRIICVGVRSCFSLAHYLAYTGHMAFENFAPPLAEPGAIADAVTSCGPADVVFAITFSRYSSEVIRAHDTACAQGADVIALTDSYSAPIARNARIVFNLPMAGPQILPSHGAGFALIEAIIGEMIQRQAGAAERVEDYERRLLEYGVYI